MMNISLFVYLNPLLELSDASKSPSESFKTLADPPKRTRWGKRGDNDCDYKTQQKWLMPLLPGKEVFRQLNMSFVIVSPFLTS